MRILVVTNCLPTPETPALGTFVEQQISGLREIGLNVSLMFIDRAGKGMRAYSNLKKELQTKMSQCHPDLVHCMYGGVMADAVTRTVGQTPTVVSFCGSDLLGELLSGRTRRLISRYGVFASHRAARRATGIVVKSRNLQLALPRDVDSSKVRIIPNGVNLERFQPLDRAWCRTRLGLDSNTFHILFPANSGDQVKRPELARAAVEAFRNGSVAVNMHELRGVPHQQVPLWLNACDVLLLTSLHEGSPNIVKEALACNLPVVSVDVGDVRERIQGVDGCYLAAPDVRELAVKLQLVQAGPRRVRGRASVESLSLKDVALRLKEFYLELLSSRGASNIETKAHTVKVKDRGEHAAIINALCVG